MTVGTGDRTNQYTPLGPADDDPAEISCMVTDISDEVANISEGAPTVPDNVEKINNEMADNSETVAPSVGAQISARHTPAESSTLASRTYTDTFIYSSGGGANIRILGTSLEETVNLASIPAAYILDNIQSILASLAPLPAHLIGM